MIPLLNIDYFNPVVADWTPECMEREIRERDICDINLYVITPKMTGIYSIAEVADDSNKRPGKTVFAFLRNDYASSFTEHQLKSLVQTGKLVRGNGGTFIEIEPVCNPVKKIAEYLNSLAG